MKKIPSISIHFNDKQFEYLDKTVLNKSAFFKDFIDLLISGKIDLKITEGKITQNLTKKEQLEISLTITRINYMQARTDLTKTENRFKKLQADYLENFEKPASYSGNRMLKKAITETPAKTGKLIYNDSIWCYICNEQFQYTDLTLFAQKENFHDHLNNAHNLIMPKHIEQELTELNTQ